MKMLIQNITVLNIILILVIALFALQGLFPSLNFQIKYALPQAGKNVSRETETASEIPFPSPVDYGMISGENLFHPERKIPAEKKAEQPLPKPEFILYGTMISDGLRLAYVEDLKAPRSSPGRGKRQSALKQGQTISGFTLQEIHNDKILLQRGNEILIVSVQDPSHPKERTESGVSQSTTAGTPDSTSKSPQRAPQSPLQRSVKSPAAQSPDDSSPRPERRLGSQKTFAPQASGR